VRKRRAEGMFKRDRGKDIEHVELRESMKLAFDGWVRHLRLMPPDAMEKEAATPLETSSIQNLGVKSQDI
jgi:hypothetical protein